MGPFVVIFFVAAYLIYKNRENLVINKYNPFTGQLTPVKPFSRNSKYQRLKNKYTMSAIDQLLKREIHFYKLLSETEAHSFRVRMRLMLKQKYFIGRQGMQVTDEMILIVGALMVQITFGYKDFTFPHFSRIAIYPDIFYSRLFERYLKGLTVYHSGVILVSWPDAEKGIENQEDKINLLLHELAHALFLDYFDKNTQGGEFGRWMRHAIPYFENMKNSQSKQYLREYASTNIQEFWAVCVEHYFEDSIQFKKEMPELYLEMCSILKQDVAAREEQLLIAHTEK
jgi:Mlc titration factor MtfA (ptsG expression regulator)